MHRSRSPDYRCFLSFLDHGKNWRVFQILTGAFFDEAFTIFVKDNSEMRLWWRIFAVSYLVTATMAVCHPGICKTSGGGTNLMPRLVVQSRHSSFGCPIAISPDGTLLASGGDTTVRIWDILTRKMCRILPGQASLITAVAFGKHGLYIASADFDGGVRGFENVDWAPYVAWGCSRPNLGPKF